MHILLCQNKQPTTLLNVATKDWNIGIYHFKAGLVQNLTHTHTHTHVRVHSVRKWARKNVNTHVGVYVFESSFQPISAPCIQETSPTPTQSILYTHTDMPLCVIVDHLVVRVRVHRKPSERDYEVHLKHILEPGKYNYQPFPGNSTP
jgi:hypothetical protein